MGIRVLRLLALSLLLVDSPAPARCSERIILFLSEGVDLAPLVPLARVLDEAEGRAGASSSPTLRVAGAQSVERILSQAGADVAARLDDGLTRAPAEWRRTFVLRVAECDSAAACAVAARLASERGVEWAECDALYGLPAASPAAISPSIPRAGLLPDDPLLLDGSQWGLANTGGRFGGVPGMDVRAPEAWAACAGNTATVIGLVDTGIDATHPELDCILADGSFRVASLAAVDDRESPADSLGHGTMVCGVMAALTGNGRGVAGMMGGTGGDSAGARIVSVKATLGHSTAVSGSFLARAIVLAAASGARAINCSIAGPVPSELVRGALVFARDLGATVVCAAGNSADERLQYPAAYSRFGATVSVGAINSSGTLADFSTRGEQVDVVAPGQDIYSTWLTYENASGSPLRDFTYASGTSFAAPFVTGMAGLAATLQPDLRDNDFQELVRRTARDLGDPGRDGLFAFGLADAAALVAGLSPPRGLTHGTAAAEAWSWVAEESLRIVRSGIFRGGVGIDGDYLARRYEVRARAVPPSSLLAPVQAWIRPSGAGGWRGGRVHEYDFPWGEVTRASEDILEARTFVYWIDAPPPGCGSCGPIGWVPRSPDEIELAWTAWSNLDAPPRIRILEPEAGLTWPAGSAQELRWVAEDPDRISRVEARWSADGGATFPLLLASSPADSGSARAIVPCRPPKGMGVLRVIAYDDHGRQRDEASAEVAISIAGAECPESSRAVLDPPFPDPALGGASIQFRVRQGGARPESSPPRISIYDLRGRLVARLVPRLDQAAGEWRASWSGRRDDGGEAASGVYFVRLEPDEPGPTRRLVWLR